MVSLLQQGWHLGFTFPALPAAACIPLTPIIAVDWARLYMGPESVQSLSSLMYTLALLQSGQSAKALTAFCGMWPPHPVDVSDKPLCSW